MKKQLLHSAVASVIASLFILPMTASAEQPKAEDLVGKMYGGIHAMHIETDHKRLITADPRSSLDNGNGLGAEFGYRWTPSTEFRFSYTHIELNSRNGGFSEPNGAALAADLLFFPTE